MKGGYKYDYRCDYYEISDYKTSAPASTRNSANTLIYNVTDR